jgi:hypothetical protein
MALAEYQRCRDEWSRGLFEITDRLASFEWTLETVGALLEMLSREMADDVKRMVKRSASMETV